MADALKLGSINFVNSFPVDFALTSGRVSNSNRWVLAPPQTLNQMMHAGSLAAGPVSSLHYAEHHARYVLLPDLSVSAAGGVDSVLLFSKVPIETLGGGRICVTTKGRSTPALLKILLEKHFRLKPSYCAENVDPAELQESSAQAALLIGDAALLAANGRFCSGLYVYDLAEIWNRWTGKPFVFAVWVIQRSFFESNEAEALRLWDLLQDSRQWGINNHALILEEAQKITKLPKGVLKKYFNHLRFDFDDSLRDGLRTYLEAANELGLLSCVPDLQKEKQIADARLGC